MAQEYYDGYLINFSSSAGYPTIYVNGKNVLLHRYIWEKYHGIIPEGYEVHHKDKNRNNYDLYNLVLVESKEHHRQHAIDNGLGKDNKGKRKDHVSGFCGERRPVIAYNEIEALEFVSISEASRILGVRHSDISRILRGERKSAKGWGFLDGTSRKII